METDLLIRLLTEFRDDMNHRFERVDQRFDALDRRFEAVDKRFDQVDQRFDQLKLELLREIAKVRR